MQLHAARFTHHSVCLFFVFDGNLLPQEEDVEVEGVQFNVLRAFHHDLRVDALAWSPESRLDRIPTIRFCTAAADRKLRLLTSDLQDRHEVKVMEGHTSYINHLVFEPTEGKQIASVSDDHTCRLWDLDGNETAVLRLRSPGLSVCWHSQEVFKLMVAEKKGTIRFYDLVTQQAILSLDCGHSGPLMSADWCLANTIKVGAVVGNDWLIWDITRSRWGWGVVGGVAPGPLHSFICRTFNLCLRFCSYPQEKRPAHKDKARLFRWSIANENLFATTGCPGKISSQVFIHHLGHPQVGADSWQTRPAATLCSSQLLIIFSRLVAACDDRLISCRIGPQLAPDAAPLCGRR
uniref:Nucleoporin Nup37 n=1 Tax=Fundulus heteroclitus TaxID=8078 RepID=A0A3Q2NTQ0_FUNHE